ncbi:hypothetical protein STENM327S_00286 [Streptomyces tendae]
MDAGNILKPALARGELHIVGATTLEEYRRIEKDAALARRFQPILVPEPTTADAIVMRVRRRRGPHLSAHRRGTGAAVELSDRYLTVRRLPGTCRRPVARRVRRAGSGRVPGADAGPGERGRPRRP